ncbi:UDP-N-acetylglucosamine 1-carboxyvinyltransferase [Modestobacter sp. I12A-02628]|uniref:UDP-N-acetylglucosamine 1-carboxyvinyltransferase n=1 Tax=Goekera deserti TaxID=2497753 RepID=A0A7K3W9C4_9ACTN|nr:UDP-N-acetylglucosamine 1-carboxyvinyltransferase [Goekera deserti]MPQ99944.1 UDP-N-acetylglucosamine 1-carboxyvinyltransferase [Goekera deserti]NDI50103.1 UDP-N-acetylglucosamine 1-carboxyvinyltransferase [Goekera deserti]NEL52420.1 UDP-N-acetylglucosamine 1-carboxyvinyltransferase [Goekera deserti]
MECFEVVGGTALTGRVRVTGAKNSSLKLMAAALLAAGRTTIEEVPDILDVSIMSEVLRRLGCTVAFRPTGSGSGVVEIDVPEAPSTETDYDLVRRMRASISVLGPLVARCGTAKVALPGGDAIGSRGLDMHVSGLEKLGATVVSEHGFLIATAPTLVGTSIWLDFPSVGATENLVMAAALATGSTVIDNAAREPEIVDLCSMLTAMGAQIEGAGTSTLTVQGVESLSPVRYTTVPDRIVAGTWAIGAVMTRGDVVIERAVADHLVVPLDKLASAGAHVEEVEGGIRVAMDERPRCVDIVTLPFPGFPTDLQPMAVALAAVSTGTALITENVFEGRFMFVNELVRLGADVRIDGHHAVVRGRERLSSAPVLATDIRAGAGLVLAGLLSDGVTEVQDVHHVDRGYPDFVGQLRGLGVQIERTTRP